MVKRNVKLFITVAVCILYIEIINSQSAVKELLVKSEWTKKELVEGLKWEYIHTRDSSIFNSRQHIHLLRISKGSKNLQLAVAKTTPDEGTLTSELAKANNAIGAVNASFFNVKTGQSVNMIKQNGKIVDTTVINKGKYSSHQMGVFVFDGPQAQILQRDTSMGKHWDERLKWPNAIESGPLLILDGNVVSLVDNAFNKNRHPRTCACITDDEVILLTADGRSNEAYGLSLFELTELLLALECTSAINFDGGGSTTMYVDEGSAAGVVNMPCDNRIFDHAGERKVANALMVLRK